MLAAMPSLAADYPAPQEGSWVVRDFRFHTGEVLPELRLHYTTVGAPTGEPVLILHGTTGSGTGMLTPWVRRRALRPRAAAGRHPLLHHPAGRHRHRKIDQTFGRPACELSEVQLRRHGRRPIPAGDGAPGRAPPAARARELDGRHADLDLGPEVSGLSWTLRCRWRRCRPRCPAAIG